MYRVVLSTGGTSDPFGVRGVKPKMGLSRIGVTLEILMLAVPITPRQVDKSSVSGERSPAYQRRPRFGARSTERGCEAPALAMFCTRPTHLGATRRCLRDDEGLLGPL